MSVVLPVPLGPTIPMRSPRMTRIEKLSMIGRPANALLMLSASITSAPDLSACAASMTALPAAPRYARRACRNFCRSEKRRTLRLRRPVTP